MGIRSSLSGSLLLRSLSHTHTIREVARRRDANLDHHFETGTLVSTVLARSASALSIIQRKAPLCRRR